MGRGKGKLQGARKRAGSLELTRFGGHLAVLTGGVHPGKDMAAVPPEYHARIIELARAERNPEELAKEFEPTGQTIRNWLAQDDRDTGRRQDGLSTSEREELIKLRRENRRLREEREILAKAAAWFSRETDSAPPKSSSS